MPEEKKSGSLQRDRAQYCEKISQGDLAEVHKGDQRIRADPGRGQDRRLYFRRKDSMLMAKLFQELERHGKKNFEVVFLVMNPGVQ